MLLRLFFRYSVRNISHVLCGWRILSQVGLKDLATELNRHESLVSGANSGTRLERIDCFRCGGTGLIRDGLQTDISRAFASEAELLAQQRDDGEGISWMFKDEDEGAWKLYPVLHTRALESAYCDGADTTVQMQQAGVAAFEVNVRTMTQYNCITSSVTQVLRADAACGQAGHPCWVCRGVGQTSQHLPAFDSTAAAEDHPCLICYDSSFSCISTECEHYFCQDCIRGTLEAQLESGQ